jgi:hypothetical protein
MCNHVDKYKKSTDKTFTDSMPSIADRIIRIITLIIKKGNDIAVDPLLQTPTPLGHLP